MAHHILVIEYEPRYIQRIEEAAVGSELSTEVARTGDEAIQALPRGKYDLIVLSTIIPRYSTAQLIRSIRNDATNASTPILLTTSGYSGTDPRSDAVKIGASDMLVKPYAPPDFIQKVRSLLNVPVGGADVSEESSAETMRLSSRQIFGDLLDESHPSSRTVEQKAPSEPEETVKVPKMSPPAESGSPAEESPEKRRRTASEDVDQMLADTLAGVRIPTARKKKPTAAEDLDKLLENTLSGLGSPRTKETKSPAVDEEVRSEPAVENAPVTPSPVSAPEPVSEPPSAEVSAAAEEAEEDPFPEVEEPEPEMPPFEGVGERAGETGSSGTTLLRDEEPAREPETGDEEPEEIGDSGHFGQYVLLEKIATGGMAEVWKARMRGLEGFEKIVAIKKILPHLSDNDEFIDMFVDEAKLAAQLSHNNIIHIYDLGKIDGSWFIAMEYNDGYDLKSLLSQGKEVERPLPVSLALFIASKVASALDYAHRKRGFDDQELGVVHRDVSPQNVLISREGDIKICDFGIAKAASKASHTQAGALKGKLQYMSPEQAWGRQVDHRSDIFATAAVLFEMLAGRKLFTGDSELSVLDQVREARVPSPSTYNPGVTSEIDEIVLKGLEKDPAARFHTAGEMARAIDDIISNFKPAPTSGDLARYIAAIEEPDRKPMPAMPVLQKTEAPPVEKPAPKPEEAPRPAAARETAAPIPVPIPVPEPKPEPVAAVAEISGDETIPASRMTELDEPPEPMAGAMFESQAAPRKRGIVPIAIIVIVILAAVAAGAVMMMRPKAEPGGPASDVSAALGANPPAGAAPLPEPTTDLADPGIGDAVTLEALDAEQLADAAGSDQLGQEDLALIEQAVRDRIDAERRRLESQRSDAAPPPTTAPTQRAQPDTPAPAKTPPASPPQSEQPKPAATAETTGADETPTPARPAATETAAPEPQVAAPQETPPPKPAVRRGDVVEPGTPGLSEPELISLKKVAYPPLARRNRVEGLVIVRALVSEDGNVLETELLRGVSQNVGLNEAAIEMVRGGKFKPGRVGDVQVRVWKTIPIPFKMQ